MVIEAAFMARKRITFDTVRKVGLGLPDVEEGTAYGSPALKVRGRMFTCLASHRSAEPGTLVVLVDFSQRDALIAERPDIYYLTDHYVNYPSVLVRLSRIQPDALRDLLLMSRRFAGARGAKGGAGRTRKRPPGNRS
jgi:hypothetical protein